MEELTTALSRLEIVNLAKLVSEPYSDREQFEIISILRQHEDLWDEWLAASAFNAGNKRIFHWLIANGCRCNKALCRQV